MPSPIGEAVFGVQGEDLPDEPVRHLSVVHQIEGPEDSDGTILLGENASLAPTPKPEPMPRTKPAEVRPTVHPSTSFAHVSDAQLAQAENLRMAQGRIIDLERELEKLRRENESLYSATELSKARSEELIEKLQQVEKARVDLLEQNEMESRIFKDTLLGKDRELMRLRNKASDLESRLAADLKKIRVRERELENRLELSKMEKLAIVRSKDETILELKARIDQLEGELEQHKGRCADLNHRIDSNHEQLRRTVRALRLALTNLEVAEPESGTMTGTLAPLKKTE